MDLPTCPACGQSVLDDDVDDCPFCGASMSGKPGTAAPVAASSPTGTSKTASRQTAPAEQPSAAKPASKNRPPQKSSSSSDNDDPFAVDTAEAETSARAIKAAPRRVKGRTYQVLCPMCETVGFVPHRAAGKEVRCANPDCLVPVFTAQEIPEEGPAEETSASLLTPMRIFAALSAVIVLGTLIAVYALFGGDDSSSPPKKEIPPETVITDGNGDDPPDGFQPDGTGKTTPPDTGNGTAKTVPVLSRAEMLKRLPGMMIELSRINRGNRSKAYCRCLTAEVFAVTGNIDDVTKQLQRMQFVAPELAFYRIPPLVLLAWNQLQTGQRTAAEQTADKAMIAAARLPDFGRTPLDCSVQLATLLVALERTDAATTLLRQHQRRDESAQLSARLQAVAALKSHDFDADGPVSPLLFWSDPQAAAVTLELVGHGFPDFARQWATGQTNPTVRSDCVAGWAEASADASLRTGQRDALQKIIAAINRLEPVVASRALARVAGAQIAAGDRAGAKKTLAAAQSAMSKVSTPSPRILPGIKALYALKLTDPAPLRMAAVAHAEIARIEARLGQKAAAWTAMTHSMNFLRATAPSLSAVRGRIAEIRQRGPAAMRAELKAALNLGNEDAARRALTRYRSRLDALRSAAKARLAIQVNLLARATEWGLLDEVWKEIQTRTAESHLAKQDPFLETKLPWVMVYRYLDAEADDKAQTIAAALKVAGQRPNLPEQIAYLASVRLKSGDVVAAAEQLSNRRVDAAWRMQQMLAVACRLVKQDQWAAAMRFVGGYADPVAREEAYELIAALATRRDHEQAVWKTFQDTGLTPTERIALARGLAIGIR